MLFDVLFSILALLVAFFILVSIHEFGHYLVARWCGVHVVRFSIGFNPVLFSFHNRRGTEFAFSAIPLGGYVKMLTASEDIIPKDKKDQEYGQKHPLQRIAIAFGGPFANLLLAFAVYFLIHTIGIPNRPLYTGKINAESHAAEIGMVANQEITAVDGKPVKSYQQMLLKILDHIGESETLTITTKSPEDAKTRDYKFILDRWLATETDPDPLLALGFNIGFPAIVGVTTANSAADRAGLKAADHIIAINGQAVTGWQDLVIKIQAAPQQELQLTVKRGTTTKSILLTPDEVISANGESHGLAGIQLSLGEAQAANPVTAIKSAFNDTLSMATLTASLLYKMVTGNFSVTNISGPITIAKVAGQTASFGWLPFLQFLAVLSISLAVINLLPIPALDGGHIALYSIEMLIGRPLPERVQILAAKIGWAMIGTIMIYAIYNDFLKL